MYPLNVVVVTTVKNYVVIFYLLRFKRKMYVSKFIKII